MAFFCAWTLPRKGNDQSSKNLVKLGNGPPRLSRGVRKVQSTEVIAIEDNLPERPTLQTLAIGRGFFILGVEGAYNLTGRGDLKQSSDSLLTSALIVVSSLSVEALKSARFVLRRQSRNPRFELHKYNSMNATAPRLDQLWGHWEAQIS